MSRLVWLRRMATELPRNLELSYCLLRDSRVPVRNKAAMGAALALIVSPLDLPAWVPVLGEADILLLTLLATGAFLDTAPAGVVEEHRRLIEERRSRFDADLARGQRLWATVSRRVRRSHQEPAAELAGVPVHQPQTGAPTAPLPTGVST